MKLYRGLHNTPQIITGCVATVGNFDGVHLGHQAMLANLIEKAKQRNLPSVVVLFEPQPLEYFCPDKAPARLNRLRDKLSQLDKCGVDIVVCLSFNLSLANLEAKQFAQQVLFEQLNVQYLMVGEDFRFGKDRKGDFALLNRLGQLHQCQVEAMSTVICHQNRRISSTRIRQALVDSDLSLVKQLLGRAFSMFGRVAHGDKRARLWGIPTANVFLHRLVVPIQGVYCVRAVIGDKMFNGVANVGTRPTVDGTRSLLEVHLFEFNAQIYGQVIEVEFIAKLRNEQRFESIEQLKQQILADVDAAKDYFNRTVITNRQTSQNRVTHD